MERKPIAGPPVERVWFGVRDVMARTGRGRLKVLTALQDGLGHLQREGAYRAGDLRGYQDQPGGEWSVHRDDVDSWVRGETPAPARGVA